jgi:hypothetical protein
MSVKRKVTVPVGSALMRKIIAARVAARNRWIDSRLQPKIRHARISRDELHRGAGVSLMYGERCVCTKLVWPALCCFSQLEALNRGYYQNVLLPKLAQAQQDCNNVSSLLAPVLGGDEQIYDPNVLPECPCDQIVSKPNWAATVTWNYARRAMDNVQVVLMRQSGSVSAQLNPPTHAYPLSGSASLYYYQAYLPNGSPFINQGGPLYPYNAVQNIGARMSLFLHSSTGTYQFALDAQVQANNNLNGANRAGAGHLLSDEQPLANNDPVLQGNLAFDAHSAYFASQHTGNYIIADEVIAAAGSNENAGGSAQVTCTLTPGP